MSRLMLAAYSIAESKIRCWPTREQLEGAPTFAVTNSPAWGDRAYESRIHDYYKTTPYWGV
jgi:hypothetical protein